MTVEIKNLHIGSVVVGFRPVQISAHGRRFYGVVRFSASPSNNTGTIFIGPGSNVAISGDCQGYPLRAGEHVDLPIENAGLWCVADDVDQELNWIGL